MGELNTMSINFLDPEKCRFYINPNGFTALKTEDKDYRRVRLLRTLPLHRPFEYISVSDMDKNEIGIIRNAADFPPESREIIEKDLAARYYCPQISEIYSIDEKLSTSLPWSTGCAADIRFARVTSTLDTIRVGINCRSILNVLRHM